MKFSYSALFAAILVGNVEGDASLRKLKGAKKKHSNLSSTKGKKGSGGEKPTKKGGSAPKVIPAEDYQKHYLVCAKHDVFLAANHNVSHTFFPKGWSP